eukprot:TRINITY_DN8062_c0_g8_i1.p1 TRINITY_DN8062_c0_g8~~TRINITY_DN8062_c0_g8_i1.p1  ORF type:complete len:545 (-),score=97.84 TRINITY_DN8062_c0_g8_i1:25-1533(-)
MGTLARRPSSGVSRARSTSGASAASSGGKPRLGGGSVSPAGSGGASRSFGSRRSAGGASPSSTPTVRRKSRAAAAVAAAAAAAMLPGGPPLRVSLQHALTGDLLEELRLLPSDTVLRLRQVAHARLAERAVRAPTAEEAACLDPTVETVLIWRQASLDDDAQTVADAGLVDGGAVLVLRAQVPLLVTASFDRAFLWRLGRTDCERAFVGHSAVVHSVTFAPDRRTIITASSDGTAKIWAVDTGRCLQVLRGHEAAVRYAVLSHCGGLALTGSNDCTARLWSLVRACGDDDTDAVDPHAATAAVATACCATLRGHTASLRGVALSPCSCVAATASDDRTAMLWQLPSGEPSRRLSGHGAFVLAVNFSPDGALVLTSSADTTARLWSCVDGACVFVLKVFTGAVRHAVFSPRGDHVATVSDDGKTRIWRRVTQGSFVAGNSSPWSCDVSMAGHEDLVVSACFSQDGRLLATGSFDGTARVWLAATGRCVASLPKHAAQVVSAVF